MAKARKKAKKKAPKKKRKAPKQQKKTPRRKKGKTGDSVLDALTDHVKAKHAGPLTPTNIPWTDDDRGYYRFLGRVATRDAAYAFMTASRSPQDLQEDFRKAAGIKKPQVARVNKVVRLALDPTGKLGVKPVEWLPLRAREGWLFAKHSEFPAGGLIGVEHHPAVAALDEVIPHPIHIDWVGESWKRSFAPPKGTPQIPQGAFTDLQRTILIELFHNGADTPTLKTATGAPRRTIQDAIKPLMAAKIVANTLGSGYWRLDAPPPINPL